MTALAAPPRRPTRTGPAPIIAVASGKGGVGKTWFSTTLACVYGGQNKRTLLIDGDLGLANVDIQLGVRPQADIAAAMRGWIELEDAVTPILGGAGKKGGFDLLSGHSGSGQLANLRAEEVDRLCAGAATLALHYDRVILDLAAGVDPTTMRLARQADKIAVVTTEEPTALTDAYAFIKVLRAGAPAGAAKTLPSVVVNMATKRVDGRKIYDQLAKATESFLGVRPPLAGVIMRDPLVPEAIRAQTALAVRSPGSPALDDVIRIADALMA